MATNLIVPVLNNNVPAALTKLKKLCLMTGLLKEMRQRSYYTKPSAKRRLKSIVARKKLRKSQRRVDAAEAQNDR